MQKSWGTYNYNNYNNTNNSLFLFSWIFLSSYFYKLWISNFQQWKPLTLSLSYFSWALFPLMPSIKRWRETTASKIQSQKIVTVMLHANTWLIMFRRMSRQHLGGWWQRNQFVLITNHSKCCWYHRLWKSFRL